MQDNYNYNPNYPNNYMQPNNPQKNSKLGIAAFVLSLLGCTSIFGLILGIVDLCKNKNNKHGFSIAAIVISCILLIGGSASTTTDNEKEAEPDYNVSVEVESNDSVEDVIIENTNEKEEVVETPPVQEEVKEIEYIECTVDSLYEELHANAMRAENKYQDAYILISGRISNFDSDGRYFSIKSTVDEYSWDSVTCDYTSEAQKELLLNYNTDDVITIKAQITSVGEVIGYDVDVIEIVQ